MMREARYANGLVGKWHLGFREQYHPLKRGFDEFFGHLGGGTSYVDPNDPDAHSWPRREPAPTEPHTIGPATPVSGDRGDGPRAILDALSPGRRHPCAVPVKWPTGLPRGEVYSLPASVLDLYATFAAAAGSDAGTEQASPQG